MRSLFTLIIIAVASACTIDEDVIICKYACDEDVALLLDDSIHAVVVEDYYKKLLTFSSFANGSALRAINVTDGDIEAVARFVVGKSKPLSSVHVLSIANAAFNESIEQTVQLLNRWMPMLEEIYFEHTTFEKNDDNQTIEPSTSIVTLHCTHCQLHSISILPAKLVDLNLAFNNFDQLPGMPPSVEQLDLSSNRLTSVEFVNRARIEYLNVSSNDILSADLRHLSDHLPLLQIFDLSYNSRLCHLFGQVPWSLQYLTARNTSLRAFNDDFLTTSKLTTFDLRGNKLWCGCAARWHRLDSPILLDINQTCGGPSSLAGLLFATPSTALCDDDHAILYENNTILRFHFGDDVILPAMVHPFEQTPVQWTKIHPYTVLGTWPPAADAAERSDHKYEVLPGGDLLIRSICKSDVERYMLTITDSDVPPVVVLVRLDYSSWLFVEVYSILAACVACAIGFAGHMLWTIVRKLTLWRIDKAERTSRVKNMLEAVEKYRVGKVNQLQTAYQARVQAIRDNYNAQMEQLWTSYTGQTERFKNYKDARVESMTGHFGNVKDNYTAQVTRMREYWRAQVERLGENYERQLNRLRAYSLQNRLKLARQYKVKQSYLKKILESLTLQDNAHCTETPRVDPEELLPTNTHLPALDAISISTFYSCTEFDITLPVMSSNAYECADEEAPSTSSTALLSDRRKASVHRLHHENHASVVLLPTDELNSHSSERDTCL